MRDLFHYWRGISSRARAIGRHLAATIRGPVLWLTFCGGLLVTAIFVRTIMMTAQFPERAPGHNQRELKNPGRLLTPHLPQQFRAPAPLPPHYLPPLPPPHTHS